VHDLGIFVDSDLVMRTHACQTVSSCFAALRQLRSTAISSRRPSSSRSSLPWFCVDSTVVMAHWLASRPTLSTDSSQCRTQRRDWYSVSVDPTTSRMHSLASTGCECLKGLFSKSPCRFIRLSTAMPRSTYGSSHRSPTSSLDKDCGLLHPTIYLFLLLDCLYYWSLSSCLNSLSPALA